MTDTISPPDSPELPENPPVEDVQIYQEPHCIDYPVDRYGYPIVEPIERSLPARIAMRTAKYLSITMLSATTIFVTQNPRDVSTMVPGLFSRGNMEVPDVKGCDPYVPPAPVDAGPPGTVDPSGEEEPAPTTTTEPPTDPVDIRANRAESAARENTIGALSPLNIIQSAREYDGYFENLLETHTSDISGIEYRFYTVGDGLPPNLNFESFEEIESAAFSEDITYFDPKMAHAIDCMRDALFGADGETGNFEGRVMPVVIPTTPACVKNFRIRYDNDCAATGYKMPRADIDFLIWDLNPDYDEFMVLTTGGGRQSDPPTIDAEDFSHELWHMQFEWTEGSNYSFKLTPEERLAKSISLRVDSSGVLDCLMPVVVYGDVEDTIPTDESCLDE